MNTLSSQSGIGRVVAILHYLQRPRIRVYNKLPPKLNSYVKVRRFYVVEGLYINSKTLSG